jgi:hypothetical protein
VRVYEAFATSDRLVKEGRECEIEFGGRVICRVWVRAADPSLNADYRRELAELSVGLTRDGGMEEIDEDTDRELLWKVYARTVITKWVWMDAEDKKDPKLRFNEKNVVELFRQLPKFFEGIQRVARQWSQYRATHEEAAKGN